MIKADVFKANLDLVNEGLVKLTWGNASALDRRNGILYIKPSGVDYSVMTVNDMVEVDLETGKSSGQFNPSSDTAIHLHLYREFPEIGGIVHTHSSWATSWAQACREIPCLGTTHADLFYASVPVTRVLTKEEIEGDYEENTGKLIAEYFQGANYLKQPGILVAEHGPFCWGKTVQEAVMHAIALEEIAKIAFHTIMLGKERPIQQVLLDKHYKRKHGSGAYYGQQ
ncbi:MAG: L-ribulose-5-phosphate 4-epimerase AraD [Bacteroidota bacterium]|nr:L-ribulose-5-phosphate 4-epimerase AraD [Bacteroidota bacterium]